jgi:hypothetical protein
VPPEATMVAQLVGFTMKIWIRKLTHDFGFMKQTPEEENL